ncbi:hypothetical protein [Vulcanisaeta sp. JCM 14467]|uniref:hypothetical protein n=1 Tax=Vulcanisaeta sp. JCM 14467 TaxID=1295370 RepID=UPI0006CF9278|nr:hypothetical protein [Vulcanisaeta sp. JCM 14467]
MSEPVLRIKPTAYGKRNYSRDILALIIIGLLWYFVGILLPPKYHIPTWEYALIQLFFALMAGLAVWDMVRQVRYNRTYRSIREFALYRDYAWFITTNGEEVTVPIDEFNPCVIEYAPPMQSYGPQYGPAYYPGEVELLINHYGIGYTLVIDTEQCRQLNLVLTRDFGKPRIDWCGEKRKRVGPIILERWNLAC